MAEALAADVLPLRELVRMVLLSGLLTVFCVLAYPRNAPTRRLLLLCAVAALTALPLMLLWAQPLIDVPVDVPQAWQFNLSLPEGLFWLWLWLWVGVAALLMLRTAVQAWRTHRCLEQLAPFPTTSVGAMLDDLAPDILGERRPRLLLGSGDFSGPSSMTLFGDRIILPPDAARWPELTLRSVLSHELVHIARRDDVALIAARVLCNLYWWMPWLQALRGALARAVEESCDDLASEHVDRDGAAYVSGLVDGAGRCLPSKPETSLLAHLGAHPMLLRVRRFAHARRVEPDVGGAYWALVALLSIVLVSTSLNPVPRAAAAMSEATLPLAFEPALPLSPQPLTIYPGSALLDGRQGVVTIDFELGADGRAYRARVRSSSAPEFAAAALNTLRATRYDRLPQSPAQQPRPQATVRLAQVYLFQLHAHNAR